MNHPMSLSGNMRKAMKIALPILIVILAMWGAQTLIASRPQVPKQIPDTRATVVEVLVANPSDERAIILAYGTVQAYRELRVHPELTGRIITQHPALIVGGVLPKGATLLRLDPRDYQFTVVQAQAAVAKAEFELQVEQGNQVVAKREWDLFGPTMEANKLSKQLALRQPHLKDKQVALAAAKSRLSQAKLDLQRTVLTVPFNAMVLSESVEVGQWIAPQDSVARLAGTDEFRIQVSVPIHQLEWIQLPRSPSSPGAHARIIRDLGNGKVIKRKGVVVELLGQVTQSGRMAQVMVAVQDPLDMAQKEGNRTPLLLGEYVQVEIEGPMLSNVFSLPRSVLREGNRVWVKTPKGILDIREVQVVLRNKDRVFVRRGLADGDQIITSQLPAAIPGLKVRTVKGPSTPQINTSIRPAEK